MSGASSATDVVAKRQREGPTATAARTTVTVRRLRDDDDEDDKDDKDKDKDKDEKLPTDEWARMCAACFAEKRPVPPPAEYFLSKTTADGTFARRDLIVAFAGEDHEPASTLRLFRREVRQSAGTSHEVVGIGEVGTLPTHRGQGLAQTTLQWALQDEPPGSTFVLHASLPRARELYAKLGFRPCVARSFVATPRLESVAASPRIAISSAALPEHAEALRRLYDAHIVPGTLRRSLEYWKTWVTMRWRRRIDAQRGRAVLCYYRSESQQAHEAVGYAFWFVVRAGEEELLLVDEFCVSSREVFEAVVGAAAADAAAVSPTCRVAAPAALVRPWVNFDKATHLEAIPALEDVGWMWFVSSPSAGAASLSLSLEAATSTGTERLACEGVFFDADAF